MTEEQRRESRRQASQRYRKRHPDRLPGRAQRLEYERRYRKKHAERSRKHSREWARAHPRVGRSYVLRTKFGITLADYTQMLEDQGGGCKICRKTSEEEGRALAVDHCHVTGQVRGILCTNCNTGLAVLEKDPQRLQRMLDYLDQLP